MASNKTNENKIKRKTTKKVTTKNNVTRKTTAKNHTSGTRKNASQKAEGIPMSSEITLVVAFGLVVLMMFSNFGHCGLIGKWLFSYVKSLSSDPNKVGAVQALCLLIVTLGTLIYTIYKAKIKTYEVDSAIVCVLIGIFLGIMSSFLGIGGGPINLVVLFFFFSMSTKIAAENSLYIIFFSQIASLISTIVTGSVPDFQIGVLVLMVAGGIAGGICGRAINKKIDEKTVDKLFIALMVLMIVINIYNIYKFM